MNARAPGKVMIAGEYAVLEGTPAIVAAINRYAIASHATRAPDVPEVSAVLAEARREGLLERDHTVAVDTASLRHETTKLGLGSSAAACVAALALAISDEGMDVDTRRAELIRAARSGHRLAQGGGSGVDVVASALGGVQCVTLPNGTDGPAVSETLRWVDGLTWRVYWSGHAARTSELIVATRTLHTRHPAVWADGMNGIRDAAIELLAAWREQSVDGIVTATRSHLVAMQRLGDAAGVPIVTEPMLRLAHRLAPLGIGLKPSGAGGGDIVIALAHDGQGPMTDRYAVECGFRVLELEVDHAGVTVFDGAME